MSKSRKPDFGQWFHQTNMDLILYKTRSGCNYHHDLFYISSYIHDSEFYIKNIKLHNKKLHILLDRIRWELFKAKNELISQRSKLIIHNVKSFRLELSESILEDFVTKELEIREFTYDPLNNQFILFNDVIGFRLFIELKRDSNFPCVILNDF